MVTYDTAAAGAFTIGANTSTAIATVTQAMTVAADANCLVVPITVWDNGVANTSFCSGTHSRTVTYNGVSMTSTGMVDNTSNNGGVEWFKLVNPPGGTFDGSSHNIVATVTRVPPATAGGTWAVSVGGVSAKNVASVTVGTGQAPASGTPSVAVSSNTGDLTVGCIGTTVADPGGYNQTQRALITTSSFSFGFAAYTRFGTAVGASPTVTHSESATGNVFVAQAINLVDAGIPAVTNQFFAMF